MRGKTDVLTKIVLWKNGIVLWLNFWIENAWPVGTELFYDRIEAIEKARSRIFVIIY